MSTGAAAHAWATEGAPDGAVVIAGDQLSPRGHAGRPLQHEPGRGVGFSLVLRPSLPAAREGFLYTITLAALVDVLGGGSTVAWPDEVRRGGRMVAAVGIRARLAEGSGTVPAWSEGRGPAGGAPARSGGAEIEWAVIDVLLPHASPPRGPTVRRVLEAVEALGLVAPANFQSAVAASGARRVTGTSGPVRRDYDRACETLGRRVRVRMRAGTGPSVEGRALATLDDGALLLQTDAGEMVPVRPQDARGLEVV